MAQRRPDNRRTVGISAVRLAVASAVVLLGSSGADAAGWLSERQSKRAVAFVAPDASRCRRTTSSSSSSSIAKDSLTKLFFTSFSAGSLPKNRPDKPASPADKIQSYLPKPEPVPSRPNLQGTVLVSGWVSSKDRTDQFVFDLLNHEESAFDFDKIVAFVDDVPFARKRLLSRSARYSGLLDKLDFYEAESEGAMPTATQFEGVKNWVAYVADADLNKVRAIAEAARTSAVENVAVLVSEASGLDSNEVESITKAMQGDSFSFTLIAVGSLVDDVAEGAIPYAMELMGTENATLTSDATFSREESIRIITECLAMEDTRDKSFVAKEVSDVNATEYKLIRGLRQGGYTRTQEIHHMVMGGAANYSSAIADFETKGPSVNYEYPWMEFYNETKEEEDRQREKEEKEQERQDEIEKISYEWAKREYFMKSMMDVMPFSEDEYIESIWERALFEGELRYKILKGYQPDEDQERADFKAKQDKMKQHMLDKAKAALSDIMELDYYGDDDGDDDDEDDDDDDE